MFAADWVLSSLKNLDNVYKFTTKRANVTTGIKGEMISQVGYKKRVNRTLRYHRVSHCLYSV